VIEFPTADILHLKRLDEMDWDVPLDKAHRFPTPKEVIPVLQNAWEKPKTLEDWPWDQDLGRPYGDINGPTPEYPEGVLTKAQEGDTNDLARYKDATDPDHYKLGDIEVIQLTEKLGFCEGNIVKYVCRHKAKNGKEDLLKARWYLDRLISQA
jgi:hypothetical protein